MAAAQDVLSAFMEDVISEMAGHIPLKAIAERILAAHAADPFGDFKVSANCDPNPLKPWAADVSTDLAAHVADPFGNYKVSASPLAPHMGAVTAAGFCVNLGAQVGDPLVGFEGVLLHALHCMCPEVTSQDVALSGMAQAKAKDVQPKSLDCTKLLFWCGTRAAMPSASSLVGQGAAGFGMPGPSDRTHRATRQASL